LLNGPEKRKGNMRFSRMKSITEREKKLLRRDSRSPI